MTADEARSELLRAGGAFAALPPESGVGDAHGQSARKDAWHAYLMAVVRYNGALGNPDEN
jgi:hypothetical protein